MKEKSGVWLKAKDELGQTAKSIWEFSLELGQRLELAKGINRRWEQMPLAADRLKRLGALTRHGLAQAKALKNRKSGQGES